MQGREGPGMGRAPPAQSREGQGSFDEEEYAHGDLMEEQKEQHLHVPAVREHSLLSENCLPPLFFRFWGGVWLGNKCIWSGKQGPEGFVNCKELES